MNRREVSDDLNVCVLGLLEGTVDGVKSYIIDRWKRKWDVDLTLDQVKVILETIPNPERRCLSIHVDHAGEHYESVIRNLRYLHVNEDEAAWG